MIGVQHDTGISGRKLYVVCTSIIRTASIGTHLDKRLAVRPTNDGED